MARDGKVAAAALALVTTACAGITQKPSSDAGAGGGAGAMTTDARADGTQPIDATVNEPFVRDADAPRCGNGKLDAALTEACDDGNTRGGDGCSADCQVEKDFDCPHPGTP